MTALLMCDRCGEPIEANEDARVELRDRGNWHVGDGPLHFHDTDECFGAARELIRARLRPAPRAGVDSASAALPTDEKDALREGADVMGMRWAGERLYAANGADFHLRPRDGVAPKVQVGPRLDVLNLSARLSRALRQAGFLTVQAVEQTPDDRLVLCRGIGRGSIETLRTAIAAFRESTPAPWSSGALLERVDDVHDGDSGTLDVGAEVVRLVEACAHGERIGSRWIDSGREVLIDEPRRNVFTHEIEPGAFDRIAVSVANVTPAQLRSLADRHDAAALALRDDARDLRRYADALADRSTPLGSLLCDAFGAMRSDAEREAAERARRWEIAQGEGGVCNWEACDNATRWKLYHGGIITIEAARRAVRDGSIFRVKGIGPTRMRKLVAALSDGGASA